MLPVDEVSTREAVSLPSGREPRLSCRAAALVLLT